jgi:hypothetical protein
LALCDRVTEAISEGLTASVKTLLQALTHEIRVESREVIHPVFHTPVGVGHQQDDAVRAIRICGPWGTQ